MSAASPIPPALIDSSAPTDRLRIHSLTLLLSDGVTGVNRVISMLRLRRYDVRSLTADLACPGHLTETTLRVDVAFSSSQEAALLDQRLMRLPSVLDVHRADVSVGAITSKTGAAQSDPHAPCRHFEHAP